MAVKLERARERKKTKKRNRYIYRSSILLVLIAATVFAVYSNNKPDKGTYGVGDDAPDFKLQQLNEEFSDTSLQLSDLQGKGVMINFWNTSCNPCEVEMPFLEETYETYRDKGIEFVSVSIDVNEFVLSKYIQSLGLSFPVVRDNNDQIKNLYSVQKLPSKVFINEDGEIVEIVEKAMKPDELGTHLDKIVPN